jgi:DNA sulfur modification protein DndD
MAEVYIDSLTLENFGPFYGQHTLDFRSLEGKCGVLVGGKNGAGKTHVLRALYLAVVGETGVGDLKKLETGSDATRFVFEKSLNRLALAEGQTNTNTASSGSRWCRMMGN